MQNIFYYFYYTMKKLDLDELKNGLPGISKNIGAYLVEAAIICLEKNGHQSGVEIIVSGIKNENFELIWSDKIDSNIINSWKDLKEATEYGATAIAALAIRAISGLLITGRIPQSEQSDYILQKLENHNKGLIEPDALLEVTGILKEKKGNTLKMRIQKKKKHIEAGANRKYPTFVIVIEFGTPKSKIIKV